MVADALARLETAARPYRERGYQLHSQSEIALGLVKPRDRFPALPFFLSLLVFWPLAMVIAIEHANKRDRRVVIRLTPGGDVEVVGDALDADEPSATMRWYALVTALVGAAVGGLA